MSETKKRGYGGGIALILSGIVLLMITLFDIDLDAEALFELWPFVLIIVGVSIMPVERWLKTTLLVIVVAAACITYEYKVDDSIFNIDEKVEAVDTTRVTRSSNGIY
ncbi:MAG: hypothetical protein J6X10_05145 [Bacteroidales bacterium]|nr:hypothetical protein [Bacteroidales bacterium]